MGWRHSLKQSQKNWTKVTDYILFTAVSDIVTSTNSCDKTSQIIFRKIINVEKLIRIGFKYKKKNNWKNRKTSDGNFLKNFLILFSFHQKEEMIKKNLKKKNLRKKNKSIFFFLTKELKRKIRFPFVTLSLSKPEAIEKPSGGFPKDFLERMHRFSFL